MPLEDYFKIGLGVLGFDREQLLDLTPRQFRLALKGYQEANGIKPKELMSRNEFLDLMGK